MNKTFFSLVPDPPNGFKYAIPAKRQLLGQCPVIFAESIEQVLALLEGLSERVCGLILTLAPDFSHSVIGSSLHHVQVPELMIPDLEKIAHSYIQMVCKNQTAVEKTISMEIELARAHEDQVRIMSSHNQIVERLGLKIEALHSEIKKRKLAEEKIAESLKEKKILLSEIHHRVKNNLQVTSSLLSLQADKIDDPIALEVFNESKDRLKSMALIHEELYESQNFNSVNFQRYLEKLTATMLRAYSINNENLEITINAREIKLPIDEAIPLGLILNELISNALKHAFDLESNDPCRVEISGSKNKDGSLTLTVRDNGRGIPRDLNPETMNSLGYKLIKLLAEDQLEGSVNLKRNGGTEVTIQV